MTTRIEDMTIDTFEVTEANRTAYNICQQMLQNPDGFRLVFFHLPAHERLHLKHAIIHYWGNSVKWQSITASVLVNDLITAIKEGTWSDDSTKYIEPDVLLFDDAQHLTGKTQTQRELYIILKQRLESKKLTVIFSECDMSSLRNIMSDELFHLINMGIADIE